MKFNKTIYVVITVSLLYSCSTKTNDLTVEKEYYKSGVLKSECFKKNGKMDSTFKVYYPDGKLYTVGSFKNGVQEGVTKVYYENGNLQRITHFRNGICFDTMKIYQENGNIQEVSYISNGQKNGESKLFFSDGSLYMEGMAKDGYRTGCWKTYDSTTHHLINVSFFYKNEKVFEADTADYRLTKIMLSDSKLSIKLPANWKVNDNYPNFIIMAGRTLKLKGYRYDVAISISRKDTDVEVSEFMDNNVQGLKQSGNFINMLNDTTQILNNRIHIKEVSMLVQYDKGKFGNFTSCFTSGGKLYIVACTAPEAIFLYYQELFKEIIGTIGMD